VAEATGSLMVGDQLLDINGHSLLTFKLSEAVDLLQSAQDTIVLQVATSQLPSPGLGELKKLKLNVRAI
jgi:PDZ domain